jgi:hypothetical protein
VDDREAIGLALCTAWASNDMESWTRIVTENVEIPEQVLEVVSQLTQIAQDLAVAVASRAGEG